MPHSAEKCKRGTLFDFKKTCIWLQNRKNSEGESHSAEKIKRGDSLVPSGFVGYLEKVKNERGDPLH